MDKYKQQQPHESDFIRRRPMDEGRRRKKLKNERETAERNNDDKSITNSNSTSSNYLIKQSQPVRGIGGSRGQSPRMGFDPQTDDMLYKTSIRSPRSPPRLPVNEKKGVNWRLACFLANEYLTRRTLLGRQWPPQDSNPKCGHGNNSKSKSKSVSLDEDDDENRREKEMLYYTLADFLRTGDVHLPWIVNPSQLASWVGLNK